MASREEKLEKVLEDIIEDFDQTGCSSDLGVVSTSIINEARLLLGMPEIEIDDEEDSNG